jgi:hypothetical protein
MQYWKIISWANKEMNRKVKIALLAVFVMAAAAWTLKIASTSQYIASPDDVLFVTLFMFEDTTQWSPGYIEREFKSIKIGQSQESVLKMLGHPLARESYDNGKREFWRYTQGKPDRNYWFRTAVFDENKLVSEIDRHYFVD